MLRTILRMPRRRCRAPGRRFAPLLALLALVPMVALSFMPAASGQLQDRLDQIKKKQTETTAEIQAAEQQVVALQNQRRALQASVNDLTAQLDAANERLAQAQADSDRYAVAALLLSIQIDETQKRLDAAKAAARRSAITLYQRGGSSGGMVTLIGSADGAGEVVEGRQYLEHVSAKHQHEVDLVTVLRAQLADQEAALSQSRKRADDARDQAATEQRRIDGLRAQQQQALDNAAASEAAYNAKVGALADQKAQLNADFQAVSDQIASELAKLSETPSFSTGSSGGGSSGGGSSGGSSPGASTAGGGGTGSATSGGGGSGGGGSGGGATSGNGTFIDPVAGPIVSGFGYRTDPITGGQEFHAGVDFGAACGTPIRAGGSGQVVSAGFNGGYGNATVVNHGGGLATLYGHQSSIGVSVGQVVQQGQVIGAVGSTGKSTGCHLHFEVRVNGNPVNPLPYL